MYISESGPTWATGPQTLGKKISEFVLDGAGNRLSGPTTLVQYTGAGQGSVVALAAGPDGLYFSDFYKDDAFTSPIDRGSNILRVRFVGAADFTASATTGVAPLSVTFTNTSTTPNPTSWQWDFGDGFTSAQQNPTHVYQEDGRYTVRLSVTGSAGVTVQSKTDYIRVGTPPKLALIAVNPPNASDTATADYLRARASPLTCSTRLRLRVRRPRRSPRTTSACSSPRRSRPPTSAVSSARPTSRCSSGRTPCCAPAVNRSLTTASSFPVRRP
ncbi:MAG: PKD domain-containing protein [Phycisphaerales bacterium]